MIQGALIFRHYARGEYFAPGISTRVRRIGQLLMVLPLLTALTRFHLHWALTGHPPSLTLPDEAGVLPILDALWVLTADYLTAFLIGGAVFLVADTQQQAAALETEAREIV